MRRICALGCLLLGSALGVAASAAPVPAPGADAVCQAWPRWDAFKTRFMSADGRIIDLGSADSRTVSEGQSYGLFFALVANDKPAFEKILGWTQEHLAAGDLVGHLPGWLWGQKKDGSWGLIDANSAADADLWIAYSLVQAGRAWHERRFTALGALLARRILQQESIAPPELGRSVLPAALGFQLGPQAWRLNPSYVPLQVLRGLAQALPDQPQWQQLPAPALRLMRDPAPHGFAPDWVEYHAPGAAGGAASVDSNGFRADAATAGVGSYDAIRVYLWAGMLAPTDPARADLLKTFQPMADYVAAHGFPPEKVDTVRGTAGATAGPSGFSAALLPLLDSLNQPALAEQQLARVRDLEQHAPAGYFSQVLTLFGTGWHDGRYRFAADGSLQPAWNTTCLPAAH